MFLQCLLLLFSVLSNQPTEHMYSLGFMLPRIYFIINVIIIVIRLEAFMRYFLRSIFNVFCSSFSSWCHLYIMSNCLLRLSLCVCNSSSGWECIAFTSIFIIIICFCFYLFYVLFCLVFPFHLMNLLHSKYYFIWSIWAYFCLFKGIFFLLPANIFMLHCVWNEGFYWFFNECFWCFINLFFVFFCFCQFTAFKPFLCEMHRCAV